MKVIVRGYPLPVKFLRPSSSITVATSGLAIVDYENNAGIALTPTITNDTTSTTLASAVSKRATSITCTTSLSVSSSYELTTTNGKVSHIYVIGVSGATAELRDEIPYNVNSGAVIKGLNASCNVSLTAAYTSSVCLFRWTLSDGRVYEEEGQVVNRLQIIPVTSEDLYRRWPRLRGEVMRGQQSQQFEPQIDQVWDGLRDRLWGSGYILDHCKRPSVWRDYLFAELALMLTEAGYNLDATNDRVTFRDSMERKRDAEWNSVLSQNNLWFDDDDDDRIEAGEEGSVLRIYE